MKIGKFPLSTTPLARDLAENEFGSKTHYAMAINTIMLICETSVLTLVRFIVQFCYPSPPMRSVRPKDRPHFFMRNCRVLLTSTKRLSHV